MLTESEQLGQTTELTARSRIGRLFAKDLKPRTYRGLHLKYLRISVFFFALCLGFASITVVSAENHGENTRVFVINIENDIAPSTVPYVKRVLIEAEKQNAPAVVLQLNTPGGRLDAALDIKDAILNTNIPVYSFVNRKAYSAGSLFALASDKIFMAPGSLLGAAAPVDQFGNIANEKVISVVREEFRTLAQLRGRDPEFAEAMVDPDVFIDGVTEQGKLLVLSADDAIALGYAEGKTQSLLSLIDSVDLSGSVIEEIPKNLKENLVGVLTNPVVSFFLISFGVLGLIFELLVPGFGVFGIAGSIMLSLFLWGHVLAGFAGWESILLIVAGLILIGLEIFFLPGVGIIGGLGLLAFLAGMFLSLIGNDPTAGDFQRASLILMASFVVLSLAVLLILNFMPRAKLFKGLVLRSEMIKGSGVDPTLKSVTANKPDTDGTSVVRKKAGLVGLTGITVTDLTPSGIVLLDGRRLDVISEGDYIPHGSTVEFITDEGYRRVVRKVR